MEAVGLTQVIQLDVDENVISIKDVVCGCLGLSKKELLDLRILKWSDDDWTTYEIVAKKAVSKRSLAHEFGGCFAVKNVYLDGEVVDTCEEDDSTASPDLSEDEEDEEDEEDDEDYESVSSESESSTENTSLDTTISDASTDTDTDTDTDASSISIQSETDDPPPFDDAEEVYATFPMMDRNPNPFSASLHPLLTDLIRSGRVILGELSTGRVLEAQGYGPADNGRSVLIYGTL